MKFFGFLALLATISVFSIFTNNSGQDSNIRISGTLKSYKEFASKYVDPRNVDVWLPPSYLEKNDKRYPVLYMHDGQNLFKPELSFAGVEWGIDETMRHLIAKGEIREAIVVGIWNTPKRFREYQPEKPMKLLKDKTIKKQLIEEYAGGPLSDNYLKFIIDELKPFIDSTFKTLMDPENTFMMGSSMGGLISIYAISQYPEIFGGVGCISTHWPVSLVSNYSTVPEIIINFLEKNLPNPKYHKIYFDYGTKTLDSLYEPYQMKMDEVMQSLDYERGKNWITRKFDGAEHFEKSWQERVHIPLVFLLGKK